MAITTPEHRGSRPVSMACATLDCVSGSGCQHRPVPYLNNVLEQDHRAIKRRVNASQGFRSFWATWRTLAGYEVIHMIRKGQACGSAQVRSKARGKQAVSANLKGFLDGVWHFLLSRHGREPRRFSL